MEQFSPKDIKEMEGLIGKLRAVDRTTISPDMAKEGMNMTLKDRVADNGDDTDRANLRYSMENMHNSVTDEEEETPEEADALEMWADDYLNKLFGE
jgi:hypothetical protein